MAYEKLSDLTGEHLLGAVPRTDVKHPFDSDASGSMFYLRDLDRTFIVFEDPSDGYRSCAAPVLHFKGAPYELGGNYPEYLHEFKVLCSMEGAGGEVLTMRDMRGQIVFEIGTDNSDDYYPCYISRWAAPPQELV